MPSKIQLDENLWFLYICLQKSDLKTIDFTAVGASTNLKPPAARMRYTRLRRQIESGTLIGTHGTPFTGSADKIHEAATKRKRGGNGGARAARSSDTEDEEPIDVNAHRRERKSGGEKGTGRVGGQEVAASGAARRTSPTEKPEVEVKEEDEDSSFSSSSSSLEDSEDEMPLAKLRKPRLDRCPIPILSRGIPFHKPYVSPYPSTGRLMNPTASRLDGARYSGEVLRSTPEFVFGQAAGEHGFVGLGSSLHSPGGRRSGFGNVGSTVGAGWGSVDWMRPQNRIGGE